MVILRTLFAVLILSLCLAPAAVLAARVQAVADRDRVGAGESLHLELRVEGKADGDPDLSVLERDWEVLSRSQNSQISIVNGDFSRSRVYALTLMPRRQGEVTIPPLCFGADCSAPLPIRVTAAADRSAARSDAPLLLEAEADAEQVMSQQQLVFRVRLLHKGNLLQGTLSEPQPTGVETMMQKLGEDRKYEIRRDGRLYQVIERIYAIFPQATGTLRIPPLQFDGMVVGAATRRDPFGRRGDRVRLRTAALQVAVASPPDDPAGRTWLPARALRLNDDWGDKTVQLTVGEPATRTLTVAAEGLQAAQLPDLRLDVPDGFKAYPDQPDRQDHPGDNGITGVLQQKVAMVPTRPGRYRLPAMVLDWWDVSARQWRQARFAPVELEVRPAPGAVVATPSVGDPAPTPPAPAAQADAASTAVAEAGESAPAAAAPASGQQNAPATGFWPWLSLALGFGWLATLGLFWRQRVNRAADADTVAEPSCVMKEKAARKMLEQAARSNDPQATRQALRAWSAALNDAGRPDLEILRRHAPAPLREALAELDRALYAPNGCTWTGDALVAALRQWRTPGKAPAGKSALPDLYLR